MRFLLEFQRKGNLARGLSCSFIVVTSKVENPHRLNNLRFWLKCWLIFFGR